jgi:hypothetical protein
MNDHGFVPCHSFVKMRPDALKSRVERADEVPVVARAAQCDHHRRTASGTLTDRVARATAPAG